MPPNQIEALLKKYNATSVNHALRIIAARAVNQEHIYDFERLVTSPAANVDEPGPTSGKTALNNVLEALIKLVLSKNPYDLQTLKVKLDLFDICCVFSNDRTSLLHPETVKLLSTLREEAHRLISQKSATLNTYADVHTNFSPEEFHLLNVFIFIEDMLKMHQSIQDLKAEIKGISATPSEFATPILLLEDHRQEAVRNFFDGLHAELLAAQYTTVGLELNQGGGLDLDKLQAARIANSSSEIRSRILDLAIILKLNNFNTVFYDLRPSCVPETKSGLDLFYDMIRDIDYIKCQKNLCNLGFQLAAQKQVLLNHGKVVFVAGAWHGIAMIHTATVPWKAFIIRSTAEPLVDEKDLLRIGATVLEVSPDPAIRAEQLRAFCVQHLAPYIPSPSAAKKA